MRADPLLSRRWAGSGPVTALTPSTRNSLRHTRGLLPGIPGWASERRRTWRPTAHAGNSTGGEGRREKGRHPHKTDDRARSSPSMRLPMQAPERQHLRKSIICHGTHTHIHAPTFVCVCMSVCVCKTSDDTLRSSSDEGERRLTRGAACAGAGRQPQRGGGKSCRRVSHLRSWGRPHKPPPHTRPVRYAKRTAPSPHAAQRRGPQRSAVRKCVACTTAPECRSGGGSHRRKEWSAQTSAIGKETKE